jgi:membrane-bound inhibitor of C-type lysozyme
MNKKLISILVIIVIITTVGLWFFNKEKPGENTEIPIKASYLCNEGKTMEVSFYKGMSQTVNPGEPPIPTGSVDLILSDGRQFNLPRTISASGVRYANQDESFIFWSKGNGALVLENNVQKSYIGCIIVVLDPGGLPKAYADGTIGFSVRYPEDYLIDTSYKYQALGPGKDIYGVKFVIPQALASGKNLSSFDTGVSVEEIPAVQDCKAGLFLDQATDLQEITENDTVYSVASVMGAAAGNRYEEKVWAIPGTNPCIAIRYFIHSTNIGNYPPDTVTEFDRTSLLEQFDKIRKSLTLE